MSSLFRFGQASSTAAPAATTAPIRGKSPVRTTASSDAKAGSSARPKSPLRQALEEKASARSKSPIRFQKPPGAMPPAGSPQPVRTEPASPQEEEDMQKVTAWQNEMDTLEQTQMQIQTDQMNLLHSQIHILTRELGDLQKHVVALTDKMDEDGAKVETLITQVKDAADEAHAAIRMELAMHGNNAEELKASMDEAHNALSKAMEDGLNTVSDQSANALADHAKAHGQTMAQLEAKLAADLQSGISDLDAAHQEKHAMNSEALENGLNNVLESAHGKLQDELTTLRHGGAGSLKELSKILADVTEQVDKIDQAVEQEHALRLEVEKKLDSMCQDLRKEVGVSIEESHAALKLEMAQLGGNQDKIKDAMADAHKALKDEMSMAHGTLKDTIDVKHRDLSDAMNQMNDMHHEKHAANATALEEGINNVLGGSHNALQADLKALRSGGAGSLKDLSKILADVTKQVDNIDQAVQKEHELRLAVEDKLDKMFGDQDSVIADIKKDMQVALKESHAALKVELAEHGGNARDLKDAMAEAHAALKDEVNLAHGSLKNELSSLNAKHEAKHKEHKDTIAALNDKHEELHAANSEKLENAITSGLTSTHNKLQEELKLLKSGGAGSLKDLSKILADVTQQVDNIDKALSQEHELRLKVEAKLDDMFGASDKSIQDLEKKMKVVMHEAHSALRLELAEHGKNANEIKAAMADAHSAMKEEIALTGSKLDNHGKVHGAKMADLEKQLRADLQKTKDEHKDNLQEVHDIYGNKHLEHAQNAQALETNLHNALANTHSKLQNDLAQLQSGHGGSLGSMQAILADVTKQVDVLSVSIDKEHDLRMAVEDRVDKMIQELRGESDAALKEAHAALRLEMGVLSKDNNEVKEAMIEAHKALKAEHGVVTGDITDRMDSHARAHSSNILDLERQLRSDFSRSTGDLDNRHRELKDVMAKHASGAAQLDQKIALLEQNSSDKHRDTFKELQVAHAKINELMGGLQGHKSKSDLAHSSLEERLAYMERALKEKGEAQNMLQGQFRGEALTREKNLSNMDSRVAKMETYFTEIADRHAKELEGANSRYRELHSKFDQHRGLHENHKNLVEQRIAHLDRAVLDASDTHSQALSAFHMEHGKEMTHLLQAERAAREAQEKTFLDYIQDARQQKDALEATVQEQLRLERVAREVQANQLKDAINHQHNFAGNAEYTDILLQERSSREAAERALERRLESFERAISMERNERAQELQRIWDAFDGHTHEAMSPIVRELPIPQTQVTRQIVQSPLSPRTIVPAKYVDTTSTAAASPEFPHRMPIAERIERIEVPITTPMAPSTIPTAVMAAPSTITMPNVSTIQRMTSMGAIATLHIPGTGTQPGSIVLPAGLSR